MEETRKQNYQPKPKQKEIIPLLYKFRYLNRVQIQKILKHKTWTKVIEWLNELTKEKYIFQFQNDSFPRTPYVYCLDTKSRKYLKALPGVEIHDALLSRIYREKTLSPTLQNHCQFLADMYISLRDLAEETNATLSLMTKTDLYDKDFLLYPHPDAYIALKEKRATKRYFLDIIDPYTPGRKLDKRIQAYRQYFEMSEWQEATGHPFPKLIFVCPDDRIKKYLTKYTKRVLEYTPELEVYLSTWKEVKTKGMNGKVLEKVMFEE